MLTVSSMLRFGWLVTQRKRFVAFVFALTLATAALEGLGLALLYPLFDSVIGGQTELTGVWATLRDLVHELTGSTAVRGYLILLLILFFIKSVLMIFQTGAQEFLLVKLREDWTLKIYNGYLRAPFQRVATEQRGQTMQNIFTVPNNMAQTVIILSSLITSILYCVVLMATLFVLNWQATMIVIATFTMVALAVKVFLFGVIYRKSKKLISINKLMKSIAIESILSLVVVRLFGIENEYAQRIKARFSKILHAHLAVVVSSAIPAQFGEFFVVASVAGAFLIFNVMFDMSFVEAAPVIGTFAIISGRLYGRLNAVLKHRIKLESILPWLQVAYNLIGNEPEPVDLDKGKTLSSISAEIVFRDVAFEHEQGKVVLENLSLRFPRKGLIGLVGPSGIGKTTVTYLLTRLYEPTKGAILIGDTDIREYSIRSLRQRMGYVPQDPLIVNATVSENIKLGAPDATEEQVVEAAKLAGAHDFIMARADGYDTGAGEQGNRFSGGERQRLAIARAIIRRPDVLIIDEGTSALDGPSAEKIRKTVEQLARSTCVIVIAHRLPILQNADLIYEFLPNNEVRTRTFDQVTRIIEEVA